MRLLIIEDEPKIAQSIKRGLTQESFAVDVCAVGDEGLEMATTEPYDLIILDRMLAGNYEGSELCEKLRERNIHTPVIMLTAKDTTRDKITGLNSGADDYLIKPFDFDELLARIRALLRRPTAVKQVILQCRDLQLNTTTKEVARGGHPIHLQPKEFGLLEYLLTHQNRTLSKDAIIAHMWRYDDIVVSNNVEVYIRLLRNKIDRPFKNTEPLIRTVHGFGYKLA